MTYEDLNFLARRANTIPPLRNVCPHDGLACIGKESCKLPAMGQETWKGVICFKRLNGGKIEGAIMSEAMRLALKRAEDNLLKVPVKHSDTPRTDAAYVETSDPGDRFARMQNKVMKKWRNWFRQVKSLKSFAIRLEKQTSPLRSGSQRSKDLHD